MAVTLDTPVGALAGVGEQRAKKLAKLGLTRAADLLEHYPRDYEDRRQEYPIRQAPLGPRVCVRAMAAEHPRRARIRAGLELVQVKVVDQTGALHLTFFNQGYVERAIRAGEEYVFFGAVEEQGRRRSMVNPIFERAGRQEDTGRVMPVYPLTAGITNHLMASLTRQVLPCAAGLPETLPQSVRQAHALAARTYAVENIHFPADEAALALARRRLIFEELFYLSVGLGVLKGRRAEADRACPFPPRPRADFDALLPFAPTGAQSRVMDQIAADLASGRPMNRLVQGDVGSGKTAVAAYACWLCAGAGYQSALMAPTEVLAEQHYRSLSALLSPAGVRVGLLTGSLPAAEKKRMRQALAAGEIDLAVGTHALISQGVTFRRLALIVADEQHRFGVAQRSALAGKSGTGGMPPPHVLVMSATPIPRTLALILYGDLDLSVIDELPPGRTPVATYVVGEDKRRRVYNFVRRQVEQGRQVYLICPAVEEASAEWGGPPAMDLKAVTTYAKQLQTEVFPDLRVDLLHGRMKPREKEAAMAAFAAGRTQVLVATTVVEVGVDVPNSSLVVIENADRFGLSQLPPAPGPGGPGPAPVLLRAPDRQPQPRGPGPAAHPGLHTDGFRIAEEDLKARGPGISSGAGNTACPR